MDIIFSTNWNGKLHNQAFTTLRVYTPMRYKIGSKVSIKVNSDFLHFAKIIAVKTIKLKQITEFDARLDSGYSRNDFIAMVKKFHRGRGFVYHQQMFSLILLERLDSQTQLNI